MGCDRGGHYWSQYEITDETRKRETSTHLLGCLFAVRGKKINDIWKLTVKDPTHNHKPSTVTSTHPIHHRMPTEVKDQVKQLTAVGITAQQVALVIHQATDHPIIAQNIYNIQKQIQLENLAGKTPMELLVQIMSTSQYKFNY